MRGFAPPEPAPERAEPGRVAGEVESVGKGGTRTAQLYECHEAGHAVESQEFRVMRMYADTKDAEKANAHGVFVRVSSAREHSHATYAYALHLYWNVQHASA